MFVNVVSYLIGLSGPIYSFPLYEILVISSAALIRRLSVNEIIFVTILFSLALFSALLTPIVLYDLISFVGLLMLSALLWLERRTFAIDRLLRAYAVSGLAIAFFALADFFVHFSDGVFMYKETFRSLRISGDFQDPNFFSSSCVLCALIFATCFKFNKSIDISIHAILFGVILLSQSRAGVISFLLYMLFYRKSYFFAASAVIAFVITNINFDLVSVLTARMTDSSSSGRVDIWRIYIDRLPLHPIGQFGFKPIDLKYTHNTILQSLHHFGIIATLLLLPFFLFLAQKPLRVLLPFVVFIPFFLTLDMLFTRMLLVLILLISLMHRQVTNEGTYSDND